MTDATNPDTPDPVDTVLAEFDARKETLEGFCRKAKGLIETSLRRAGIPYQSVQARVKRREKLKKKYQDPGKHYRKLDDITDQAALRIITYYEDEVNRVAEVIKHEFEVDPEKSVDKRETEPDRFGYFGLNFVCRHLARRRSDVEYEEFADLTCEIQVTSILRHAWAEIEHSWYDLKAEYPDSIKRRFSRLAALLEIAEAEFLDLRKRKLDYRQSVDVQVEARVPDIPLDAVSLSSFIQQEPLVAELDRSIAQALHITLAQEAQKGVVESVISRIVALSGMKTVEDVRDSLTKYYTDILEYVRRARQFWRRRPTAVLMRGSCIFHLSMMYIALGGMDPVIEAMKTLEIDLANVSDINAQVALAREIMSRNT